MLKQDLREIEEFNKCTELIKEQNEKKNKRGKNISGEFDIILVTFDTIYLFEVKSDIQATNDAKDQLDKGEAVMKIILAATSKTDISIKKVVAYPIKKEAKKDQNFFEEKSNLDNSEQYLEIDIESLDASNHLMEEISNKRKDLPQDLMLALAFLKCGRMIKSMPGVISFSQDEIHESVSEEKKSESICRRLATHEPLQTLKITKISFFICWTEALVSLVEVRPDLITQKQTEAEEKTLDLFHSIYTGEIGARQIDQFSASELEKFPKGYFLFIDVRNGNQKFPAKAKSFDQAVRSLVDLKCARVIDLSKDSIFGSEKIDKLQERVNKDNYKTHIGSFQLRENTFVWLDPLQTEILNDKNSKQIIIGPASTGKTILIFLKVLNIFKNEPDSNVLIILPYKQLVKMYLLYFNTAGLPNEVHVHESYDSKAIVLNNSQGNLFIVTHEEDWLKLFKTLTKNPPHVLIDEFAAINSDSDNMKFGKAVIDQIKNFKDDQILWISIDYKQSIGSFVLGGAILSLGITIEGASVRHLTMIHRCTKNVFNEYKHHCGPMVRMGHQLEGSLGEKKKTVSVDNFVDIVTTWAENVEAIVIEKNWTGRDTCIILVVSSTFCELLIMICFFGN
jgi:hypothetical protein